jgi:capsular polysaccharide transport system ATP-binding protein
MIKLRKLTKYYNTNFGKHYVFRDIDCDLPEGKNIGILGPNGAGKSTLLRILGGIDFPSAGRIESTGSISWPLGLRGGFVSHISGRENCKIVARIHGMHGNTLSKALESIKEMAGIGDYFEEPVKTYSSGMGSRLGFALSMAFDFDYFLIDEITSVGDAHFKEMARAALNEKAAKSNIIMVSHNTADLQRFCDMAILLKNGEFRLYESVRDAIEAYLPSSPLIDSVDDILPDEEVESSRLEVIIDSGNESITKLQDEIGDSFAEIMRWSDNLGNANLTVSEPSILVDVGRFFNEMMMYENALKCFTLAKDLGDGSYDVFMGEARAAQNLGMVSRQKSILVLLLKKWPNDKEANRMMAQAHGIQGFIVEAIRYQAKCVQLDKTDHRAWSKLSGLYFDAFRLKGAIKAITRSINLDPANPFYYRQLSKYLSKSNAPKLMLGARVKELNCHDSEGKGAAKLLNKLSRKAKEVVKQL